MTAYFPYGIANTNITGAVISGGPAAAMAVLVNDTNLADAVWIPFSAVPYVLLGTNDGVYQVEFGLIGSDGNTNWTSASVTLDTVPPILVITNPISSTTEKPIIQVQGYSLKPLSSIYFDVTNAAGSVTNQQGFVVTQSFDTNVFNFTTNYFQCFDVPLTNGLNTIIIHATDIAGNTTTTNLSFTLDLSGYTNSPTIQICWPTNGTQISGTNYTLDGQVDNSTVTISASTTDANGNIDVISGIVERNGKFWVEEIPLKAGTNTLVLTVKDAAGNTSVTNINVSQSDAVLTMNPVTPDSQLWQPTVNLTGNISDVTASVWINGIDGTNNGDGTWSASNVPTSPGGIASFLMKTYVSGNSVQSKINQDKPPQIFIYEHHDHWAEKNTNEGTYGWEFTKIYTAQTSVDDSQTYQGNITSVGNFGDLDPDWWWNLIYNWSNTNAGGNYVLAWDQDGDIETNSGPSWGDNFLYFGNSIPAASMVNDYIYGNQPISHFYSQIEYFFGDDHYIRDSKTRMKIRTGGKAGVSHKNLLRITASGIAYGRPQSIVWGNGPDEWQYTPETNIVPSTIQLLGKSLGNDGNLYIVLPDNVTLDLNIIAPPQHYSMDVSAQKYKLHILANGYPLAENRVRPNANYCVGQYISFDQQFLPSLPETPEYNPIQWVLGGKFVNEWFRQDPSIAPNGSLIYTNDADLLKNTTTPVWWVSGGYPSTNYNVNLGEGLTFPNGQYVTVTANGEISMFRPLIQANNFVHSGAVALITNNLPQITLGMDPGANYISWTAEVELNTNFSANLFNTQLVNWYDSYNLLYIPYSTTTANQFWLDNFYTTSGYWPVNPDNIGSFTTLQGIPFGDGPDITGIFSSYVELDNSFKTYVRFQPTSANSIPITIERVEWGEQGEADFLSGAWNLVNSSVIGPTFYTNDDSFPVWPNVFNNK